jgi:hypothetical protein
MSTEPFPCCLISDLPLAADARFLAGGCVMRRFSRRPPGTEHTRMTSKRAMLGPFSSECANSVTGIWDICTTRWLAHRLSPELRLAQVGLNSERSASMVSSRLIGMAAAEGSTDEPLHDSSRSHERVPRRSLATRGVGHNTHATFPRRRRDCRRRLATSSRAVPARISRPLVNSGRTSACQSSCLRFEQSAERRRPGPRVGATIAHSAR